MPVVAEKIVSVELMQGGAMQSYGLMWEKKREVEGWKWKSRSGKCVKERGK
jgi:hypothetical protein